MKYRPPQALLAAAVFCGLTSAAVAQYPENPAGLYPAGASYPQPAYGHAAAYGHTGTLGHTATPRVQLPPHMAWQANQAPPTTGHGEYAAPYAIPASCTSPSPCDSAIGCNCAAGACNGGTGCNSCGWYGGVGFIWLRPRYQEGTAVVVDPAGTNNIVHAFDHDYEFTPRFWLGYNTSTGGGVRVRYWYLDGSADNITFSPTVTTSPAFVFVTGAAGNLSRNAFASVGETITSSQDLNLQAFDLEVTQRGSWWNMEVLGGLGLRYASVDQDFGAVVTTGAGVIDELLEHQHSFDGVGPTVSLELLRPFAGRRLAVYGGLRGSILFGDADQRIYELKGAGTQIGTDTSRSDEVLSIGEIEFGLSYTRPFRNNSQLFIRAGYEGQIWWGAGGPIDTDSDLGLDGFALAFGILR